MNTILITGSQGFLGRAISQKLKSRDVNLILTGRRPQDGIYLCDLMSTTDLAALVNYCKPDLIINCAASVPQSPADYNSKSFSRDSLMMLKNILASSSCPVLHISSMTVYGQKSCAHDVFKESDAGGATSEYGLSKWESELLLKSDPRPTLSIRIPGLYGLSKKSGLVYNTLLACKNFKAPILPQEPVLWSAMHVDDAATIVAKIALNHAFEYTSLNCGYPGKMNVNIFLAMVANMFNVKSIDTPVQHPTFEFDLTLAQSLTLVPNSSFESSLVDFAAQIP